MIVLNANNQSYIPNFTPDVLEDYQVTNLALISNDHLYILQDPARDRQGLDVSSVSYLWTIAEAVAAGIITTAELTATTYSIRFISGVPVMFLRITPTAPLIDFESSSGINEEDLDVALSQAMLVAQEAREYSARSGYLGREATSGGLFRVDGTSFVAVSPNWSFGPGGFTGYTAEDFLVFIDGVQVTDFEDFDAGTFEVLQADFPAPQSYTVISILDYLHVAPTVEDDTISTAKLIDGAVTEDKLADSSVSTDKLQDASVTAAKLAPGAVSSTVTTEGTKITGDGSPGSPITLANYSMFNATPGAFMLNTPGAEDWEFYQRTGVGYTNSPGVHLRVSSSADAWGNLQWRLADKDYMYMAMVETTGSTVAIRVVELLLTDVEFPASVANTKRVNYGSAGTEGLPYGTSGFIPKGFYFNLQALDNANNAGATVTIWLFPMDHRPVA
jgi:hypothetical protein